MITILNFYLYTHYSVISSIVSTVKYNVWYVMKNGRRSATGVAGVVRGVVAGAPDHGGGGGRGADDGETHQVRYGGV